MITEIQLRYYKICKSKGQQPANEACCYKLCDAERRGTTAQIARKKLNHPPLNTEEN
jgi:hypothetical protein